MLGAFFGDDRRREPIQPIPAGRLRRIEQSFRRRLSDLLEDALHRACVDNDLATAEGLYKLLESLQIRRVQTYGAERRINKEGVVRAAQALDECRQRNKRDAQAADWSEGRQWSGVWVGAWGALKHVLLVEPVSPDGKVPVVFAVGDNPSLGSRRGWSRHEATLSGCRLTIAATGFTASYNLDDQDRLSATYSCGEIVSRTAMTKIDLATLLKPGGTIPWTGNLSGRVAE
jgi:hypothetical protein